MHRLSLSLSSFSLGWHTMLWISLSKEFKDFRSSRGEMLKLSLPQAPSISHFNEDYIWRSALKMRLLTLCFQNGSYGLPASSFLKAIWIPEDGSSALPVNNFHAHKCKCLKRLVRTLGQWENLGLNNLWTNPELWSGEECCTLVTL